MSLIFLIRHGETDWNREHRVMGNLDIPLNPLGVKQIKALLPYLRKYNPSKIFTSPLLRTTQSAEILGEEFGLKVIPDKRLIEMQFGKWEGESFMKLIQIKEFQDYFAQPRDNKIPGVEDLKSVLERGVNFIEEMKEKTEKGSVIVMTHGDVVRTIVSHYLQVDLNYYLRLKIDNGSLTILEMNQLGPFIKMINYCPELSA